MELEWALDGTDVRDSYEWNVLESVPENSLHPRRSRGNEAPLSRSFGQVSGRSQSLLTSAPSFQTRSEGAPWVLDWGPMLSQILADVRRGRPVGEISAAFHNGLAEAIVAVARAAGQGRVALSGGCFQNQYLTERTVKRLRAEGFQPYWHQRIPPNDGGIALGQIIAARRRSG